ncbi:hypothetical protein CDL12_23804 [Handroanthus impetiginosus]|uniref:Proteinase inhibitor I13, potato inhibitor I n=1 Tax=Handroanthus impetiginosus TaxID=429701 RepID=A0A2G9GEG5_9LAMI|nr:hypothetical protein CDL12_23804 [Handroanthus impetiginosus]
MKNQTQILKSPMETIKHNNLRMPTQGLCEGKQSWPELVGYCGGIAVKIIEKESPGTHAIIVPPDQKNLPLNFVCGRVFVLVDEKGIVERIPIMG